MQRYYTCLFIICSSLLLGTACKKSSYLTDEGLHDPRTPLSVYQYLKQHPWQLFDTLTILIDHYQLQEEIDHAGTVFAPTDYSIVRYMKLKLALKQLIDENAKYTFDSLYQDITADSIRQYLFPEKLPVSAFTNEQPLIKENMAGTTCAIQKKKTTDQAYYEWSSAPVYFLYYIKIRGELDPPNTTPVPNDPDLDISVVCQTTGIQTLSGNGPLLHVLSNEHVFARF